MKTIITILILTLLFVFSALAQRIGSLEIFIEGEKIENLEVNSIQVELTIDFNDEPVLINGNTNFTLIHHK